VNKQSDTGHFHYKWCEEKRHRQFLKFWFELDTLNILTPVAGPIFDHIPKEIFLHLISRTAISPDFASFLSNSSNLVGKVSCGGS